MDRFVKQLPEGEGKVFTYAFDISKKEEVDAAIAKTVTECPPIDILVNNVSLVNDKLTLRR
jgi:NAD(P)-dependent dehydrogenase (short-subunit alcohol dehydrogenase family)